MIQVSARPEQTPAPGSSLEGGIASLEGILSQIELTEEQRAAVNDSIASIKHSAELILSDPPDLSGLLPYVQDLLAKLERRSLASSPAADRRWAAT